MNNLLDLELDTHMERTRLRHNIILRYGSRNLWIFASVTVIVPVVISLFLFPWTFALFLAGAVVTYVFWYTLILKRKSPFGAIPGGLPGALPMLAGAASASLMPNLTVWLFFLYMMMWQPAHFWALALKLKEDYRCASIPVLPVSFDDHYTKLFIGIYGISLLPITLIIGAVGHFGWIFRIGAIVAGLHYIIETIITVYIRPDYDRAFKVSLIYMSLLMAITCADLLYYQNGQY